MPGLGGHPETTLIWAIITNKFGNTLWRFHEAMENHHVERGTVFVLYKWAMFHSCLLVLWCTVSVWEPGYSAWALWNSSHKITNRITPPSRTLDVSRCFLGYIMGISWACHVLGPGYDIYLIQPVVQICVTVNMFSPINMTIAYYSETLITSIDHDTSTRMDIVSRRIQNPGVLRVLSSPTARPWKV